MTRGGVKQIDLWKKTKVLANCFLRQDSEGVTVTFQYLHTLFLDQCSCDAIPAVRSETWRLSFTLARAISTSRPKLDFRTCDHV